MLSLQARSFISSLLEKALTSPLFHTQNPHQRLGHHGVEEVRSHPFFRGIDWNHVRSRETPLPLTPSPAHREENGGSPFDRFAPYIDGTDRCQQKRILRALFRAWVRYDAEAPVLCHLDAHAHGLLPRRTFPRGELPSHASSAGFFQFASASEFAAHLRNERETGVLAATCLGGMTVRLEEKTMLFENDRCVGQWRLWGSVSLFFPILEGTRRNRSCVSAVLSRLASVSMFHRCSILPLEHRSSTGRNARTGSTCVSGSIDAGTGVTGGSFRAESAGNCEESSSLVGISLQQEWLRGGLFP